MQRVYYSASVICFSNAAHLWGLWKWEFDTYFHLWVTSEARLTMYYSYYLFSESNTKMTPTSQEAVSGEVLGEHVSRILVHCNKVQGHLSFANFFSDIVEANVNMLCSLLLDWIWGIKYCPLIVSTEWDCVNGHPKFLKEGMHPDKLSASVW